MNILVLGGSGYIGQHLLKRMADTVGVTAISASRGRMQAPAGIATVQLDTRDEAALTLALAGMDCVINAVAGDALSISEGATTLVRAAQAAGCERIVHLSTMSVYGRQEGTLDESAPFDPGLGWYAQAKCAAEQEIANFVVHGGNAVILRPGCVYGTDSQLWVGRITRLLKAGRLGDLGAQGDGWSNLVHVDDVCSAILAAIPHTLSQYSGEAEKLEVFNLAAPDSPRWNDYFRDLALAVGATPLKRIPVRRIKADACIAGPVIKITEKIADKLGIDRSALPDPIPPALLRFFGQQIRLDSRKAERMLGLDWMPYRIGLTDSVQSFRAAA
jgi:nucleoside-diphosphate-sugar epimerase